MTACARMIVDLNISQYRDLLKTETEPLKRRAIANLLAEEEARLAKLFVIQADRGR
jgi:hypothetical protein